MLKRTTIFSIILITLFMSGCNDENSFTLQPTKTLEFSVDTINFDTLFSQIPSSTQTFWVYNNSGENIRCKNIKLEKGNQTGFRVNVNGIYIGQEYGFQMSNEEIRNKDSIRVFIEITPSANGMSSPQLIEDNLVFTLESGVKQKICLMAHAWDAEIIECLKIDRDTTLLSQKPMIIRKSIDISEGNTLTIAPGKTIYFHNMAKINVYGKLICAGEPDNEIKLRGDRLDNMFDYLPYDGVSGQWGGIHFYKKSYGNLIRHTDIHSANTAIKCDSSDIHIDKLTIEYSTIHNNKGYGLHLMNSKVNIYNSQITNTLNDCISITGGNTNINNCTIAQFYPFDGKRGYALQFSNFYNDMSYPLESLNIQNTIITGYAEDVIMGNINDTINADYLFEYCLLRTPEITDTIKCRNVIWENVEDTISAASKNFMKVDTEILQYDFRLADVSKAINAASKTTSLKYDRNATNRDDNPDMGCYEKIASPVGINKK